MADFGGFDHNEQTFRIVTALERRYAAFDGLNLTWEALEGVVKHNGPLTGAGASAKARARPVPPRIAQYSTDCRDLELDGRSEEHTSELQSLVRISYAVFCLKKQRHNNI